MNRGGVGGLWLVGLRLPSWTGGGRGGVRGDGVLLKMQGVWGQAIRDHTQGGIGGRQLRLWRAKGLN